MDKSRDETRVSQRAYVPQRNAQTEKKTLRLDAPSGEATRAGHKTEVLPQTIPQMEEYVAELRDAIKSGSIAVGNVELAALLGFEPASRALGRSSKVKAMNSGELIKFLLTDPNLRITIDVG